MFDAGDRKSCDVHINKLISISLEYLQKHYVHSYSYILNQLPNIFGIIKNIPCCKFPIQWKVYY